MGRNSEVPINRARARAHGTCTYMYYNTCIWERAPYYAKVEPVSLHVAGTYDMAQRRLDDESENYGYENHYWNWCSYPPYPYYPQQFSDTSFIDPRHVARMMPVGRRVR